MQLSFRHTALAATVFALGLSSAWAGDTTSPQQSRMGVQFNLPFDGSGLRFQDTTVHLVFQKANVSQGGTVNGWQVSVGSRLNSLTPFFGASALHGSRCIYGSLGVSYGAGQWGIPLFIHGPFSSLGLLNQGGLGGFSAGVGSLDCFDRYRPTVELGNIPSNGSAPTPSGPVLN